MSKYKEERTLTSAKIQCRHCSVKNKMEVMCEGEDSHIFGDQASGCWEDVDYVWQVLKCSACSQITVVQYSSSPLWAYTDPQDGDKDVFPTHTDILFPHQFSDRSLDLKISTEAIEKAIADIKVLIAHREPISSIDRVHTAFHSYLRELCSVEGIQYGKDDKIVDLFGKLRQHHPKLRSNGDEDNTTKLLRNFSKILDSLNHIRNHGSLAHPSKNMLAKEEALLALDVAITLLRYLDSKLM